jgi:proteasome lid subunit RPN8/RPN11
MFNKKMTLAFEYIPYDLNKHDSYDCIYVVLSERAYKSILAETFTYGDCETGGILLGHFVNKVWYVIENVDPGIITVNRSTFFQYDENYVNHQIKKISRIYNYPLTILGIWHRHPGSMDTFSSTDLSSINIHVSRARVGILSMLVNVDPSLRMTFYYCDKKNTLMKVPYDYGDRLIIKDIISLADFPKIQENVDLKRKKIEIKHKNYLLENQMPLSIEQDAIPIIKKALQKNDMVNTNGDFISPFEILKKLIDAISHSNKSITQWYETNRELYELEYNEMKKCFPQASLSMLNDGKLCWNITLDGIIDNKGVKHSWTFKIIYDSNHPCNTGGSSIKVYLINPSYEKLVSMVSKAGRKRIPHIFSDNNGNKVISTPLPKDNQVITAVATVGFAASWATHFMMGLDDTQVWNKFVGH